MKNPQIPQNSPDRIDVWPLDQLIPYARNPRKNDAAVSQMVASIREFGFKIPCLVRADGEVVDGHLRLKAARQLGLAEVPVILCDEWTPAQVKAFRLMVNRSVTWADWDEELLALELLDLQTEDFDLSLTGFSEKESTRSRLKPIWPKMKSRRCRSSRHPQLAISGCAAATAFSAATPPSRKMWRDCWATTNRCSWSPIRRTASSLIQSGATKLA